MNVKKSHIRSIFVLFMSLNQIRTNRMPY